MKTSKTPTASRSPSYSQLTALALAAIASFATSANASNITWAGGTASYTNAADWNGGVVPGLADNAINDNGSNNAVLINVGNPDWSASQIRAGNSAGSGAFTQNGQTVSLTGTNMNGAVQTVFTTPFRLGLAVGQTGVYTLNGGTLYYTNGGFDVGELGTGILNINGGLITGNGNFAANLGTLATPTAVNATVGGGLTEGDFTWFQQGLYTPDATVGLPAPGSTITSISEADHSYITAPSYAANNAVLLSAGLSNATIGLTPSVVCSNLSLLGSAGNGPVIVNYVVHHADSTTETGSLSIPDWFGPGTAPEVMAVGARVDALGINFQTPTPANGFTGNAPYLFSFDIALANKASAVTSVALSYVSGGSACLLGISSQASSGGNYTPLAMSGYNVDAIVEIGAVSTVSNTVTDIVNQVSGAVNVTGGGQLFVGNVGTGIYNLSGGSIDVHNYIAFGRSSGNGTFNMTGGNLNQDGGGNLLVGTGFNNNGNPAVGVFNQSGGTVISQGQFLIPESSPSSGTFNLSGTGTVIVSNWIAVGRDSGNGTLNMNGGSLTKAGDNGSHLDFGASAIGIINQTNGVITNLVSDTYVGENGSATWNVYGGSAILANVIMCLNGSASGTINLSGGLFQASAINSTSIGVSVFNFNGGILQANANNPNFMSGISLAQVSATGAIIDSQGFNIGISQALSDNGGGTLTKNGTGTLTLSGANSYAGATVVNAGALIVGTSSSGGGSYTIANNAGFGTIAQSANGQLNVSSLTTSASTGSTLSFDLDGFGNPSSAPLNIVGTWTASGTYTINIADSFPQLGQFSLIKYGALSGTPSFVLGTLPVGVTATLVNNTANNSVDLNITGVNQPRWDGEAGGTWDIGLTTNWVNVGTGQPTFYTEGSPVLFDDNALGSTTVTLATTVHPNKITITNNTLNYTFEGSGSIAGSFGLNKQGSANLSLLNNNNYTGPTEVSAGTLTVTNLLNGGVASPLGSSSASPTNLVIDGATFSYAGAPVKANRGFTVTSAGSTLDTEGNLTLSGQVVAGTGSAFNKTGPAMFTLTTPGANELSGGHNPGIQVINGTMMLDGSAGGQTNHTLNEMWVGGTPATGASLIVSNTILNVDSWLGLGRGNGTINNTSSLALYNSSMSFGNVSLGYNNGIANNWASQFLTLNNSTLTNHGDQNLAESTGSSATVELNGNSVLWCQNRCYLAGLGGSTTGSVVVADSSQMIINNGWFSVANGNNSQASLTIKSNGVIFVSGDFNITDTGTGSFASLTLQDNALGTGNAVYFGKSGGETAVVNMSGGTLIARGGDLQMGASGNATFNQIGGTVIATNWMSIGRNGGGSGVYNLSAGTVNKIYTGNGTRLNVAEAGTGTLNVTNSGAVILPGSSLDVCSSTGNGTVNLNGGSIACGRVTHLGSGTATFNFNGGTLIASNTVGTNFFMAGLTAANVQSGGAVIDTGTNLSIVAQPLLNAGGGLTKLGVGILQLNGSNTYSGPTLVNAGLLAGSGTIISPVTIASGASIGAGSVSIGTLTIDNTLSLSGGSSAFMRISSSSNEQITGLSSVTYAGSLLVSNAGGALTVGTVYKLFNATNSSANFSSVTLVTGGSATFDPATGNLTITAVPVFKINPPVVSGGNLILTGAGGAPGSSYTLLSSTNVAMPLINWSTNTTGVLNGSGGFSNAIPVNPAQSAEFFRVRTP